MSERLLGTHLHAPLPSTTYTHLRCSRSAAGQPASSLLSSWVKGCRVEQGLQHWLWLACLLSISRGEGSSPAMAQCEQATPHCCGHRVSTGHTHRESEVHVWTYRAKTLQSWCVYTCGMNTKKLNEGQKQHRHSLYKSKCTTCTQTVNKLCSHDTRRQKTVTKKTNRDKASSPHSPCILHPTRLKPRLMLESGVTCHSKATNSS